MIKYVNKENFKQEVLESEKAILVDFFATWCGPCQMLGKALENISTSREDFDIAKIDIDNDTELAIEYKVEVVPTMIIFKNGESVKRLEGYLSEDEIANEMLKFM